MSRQFFRVLNFKSRSKLPDLSILVNSISLDSALSRCWRFIADTYKESHYTYKDSRLYPGASFYFNLCDYPFGRVFIYFLRYRDLGGIDSFEQVFLYAPDRAFADDYINSNFFDCDIHRVVDSSYSYMLI